MSKLNQLHQIADRLLENFRWTNTYGVARSLLAFGTLLTLSVNNIDDLIHPTIAKGQINDYHSLAEFSLYNLFPEHLELVRYFSILILLLVVSGWRPRVTGFFHWWVSFSFANAAMVIDGGDQITGLFTLLLLPICWADSRKWHWTNETETTPKNYWQMVTILMVISCFFVLRLQVAFIYFHAGIGKLGVEEWINGTAVYYWFNHPNFGLSPVLKPFFDPLLQGAFTVTLLNWGVVLFELLLFLGLAIPGKWRPVLLKAGLLFHLMIIVVHGLVSFFFAMAGALILYLGPIATGFQFPKFVRSVFYQKPSERNTYSLIPRLVLFQKIFSKIVKP